MTDPWRPFQPGDDPLALRYMTPEQIADLVERVRAISGITLVAKHRAARQGRGRDGRWLARSALPDPAFGRLQQRFGPGVQCP